MTGVFHLELLIINKSPYARTRTIPYDYKSGSRNVADSSTSLLRQVTEDCLRFFKQQWLPSRKVSPPVCMHVFRVLPGTRTGRTYFGDEFVLPMDERTDRDNLLMVERPEVRPDRFSTRRPSPDAEGPVERCPCPAYRGGYWPASRTRG